MNFTMFNSTLNDTVVLDDICALLETTTSYILGEQIITTVMMVATALLTMATLVFGLLSWTIIPKFRVFKNFVFINVAVTAMFFSLSPTLSKFMKYAQFVLILSFAAHVHWMLIISLMFYMDIVKIFKRCEHVYFKVFIFGWGPPALIAAGIIFMETEFLDYLLLACSIINVCCYLRVVYALVGAVKIKKNTELNLCRMIGAATVICVASGFVMVLPIQIIDMILSAKKSASVFLILYTLEICLVELLFMLLKTNRELWKDYIKRRRNRNNLAV